MLETACKAVVALTPASNNAGAVAGAVIDTLGFSELMMILNSGACATGGSHVCKIQECATSGGTYADITGAAFTEVDEDNDNAVQYGVVRITPTRKRYMKLVGTVADAACILGAVAVLGGANNQPAGSPVFEIHS